MQEVEFPEKVVALQHPENGLTEIVVIDTEIECCIPCLECMAEAFPLLSVEDALNLVVEKADLKQKFLEAKLFRAGQAAQT